MLNKSCVSDRPLEKYESDTLKNQTYVDGLLDFILNAEAPVTIGIQGGWGSGKTSLINMLRDRLQAEETDQTLCIFVNAWEHSLFQAQGGKADVTLSLLHGLLDEMRDSIKNSTIPEQVKAAVLQEDGLLSKAKKAAFGLAFLGIRAALKVGADLDIGEKEKEAAKEAPSMAKIVRELRTNLTDAVANITKEPGCPKRFVCFIDDLDRVPPETAVEILDVTKNVFDIPHCIFVLAIDYEVVVKGLEGKFGKKTEENEREFRQYFDKIIQIPFTMPVGAYDAQMRNLLESCFASLGFSFSESEESTAILENIKDSALAATGGIPRSVKRIINTVSLLQRIAQNTRSKDAEDGQRLNDLEILFIVVSLHINFPEICYRLMETPGFTEWNTKKLEERWSLGSAKIEFEKLKNYGEAFDEPWEQVVYCLCQKNYWLKAKVLAASNLLNSLRTALQRRVPTSSAALSENEVNTLENVLDTIRVVSVEDMPIPIADNSKAKTDEFTRFCQTVHSKLQTGIPALEKMVEAKHYAGGRVKSDRWYSVNMKDTYVEECFIEWLPGDCEFNIGYSVAEPTAGKKKVFYNALDSRCAEEYIETNKSLCFFTKRIDSYANVVKIDHDSCVKELLDLYRKVVAIRRQLD